MKKLENICYTAIVVVLIGITLFVANGEYGNPYSRIKAKHVARKYIAEKYPDQNLHIEKVEFSHIMGGYTVMVASLTSIDTQFGIEVSNTGEIYYDNYNYVESGWNTHERLNESYHALVESVFEKPKFPFKAGLYMGKIKKLKDEDNGGIECEYGLDTSLLEKDKEYDINSIAAANGNITCCVYGKDVSYKKAAELLLQLKEQLEAASVAVHAIDFVLDIPIEEQNFDAIDKGIELEDFLYSDIRKDGLEERVKQESEKYREKMKQQE